MNISDVRRTVDQYSEDQLRVIIAQLYKAIPKAVREAKAIDDILRDPGAAVRSRQETDRQQGPDIDELKYETDCFVEDAYKQYYFAPNRIISKRDRPKWRFIVKRLYKDILASATDESDVPEAAQLMEKLYQLLCYSCKYMLFSSDEPFQSVGITQEEFFRKVLSLKYRCEDKNTFIRNALLSMVNNSPRQDFMEVILEFAKTPDMKHMVIANCSELMKTTDREPRPAKGRQSDYDREERVNNLTTMAFLCYARLYEYPNAISYFKENYRGSRETTMYALLRLLFVLRQKDYFLREYEEALKRGVALRDTLQKAYRSTKETGELPAHLW